MTEQIYENIYRIPVTLPLSPLKYLNCYVLKSDTGKNLLIDTGFNEAESWDDLCMGMSELGLTPDNTDIFITHFHADHTGNAGRLCELGYHILMSERDYHNVLASHMPDFYGAKEKMIDAGVPAAVQDTIFINNPAPVRLPPIFDAQTIRPGQILHYAGYELECLDTSGHSPGHISLYSAEKQLLFLGDHVLFDITPNIVIWETDEDALGKYLENLEKLISLPVKLALPAHRTFGKITVTERAQDLIAHHHQRMNEISSIVEAEPGLNAYEISSRMTWSIRARCWDAFPPTQKYFATCEGMAHLKHMCCVGQLVEESDSTGIAHYYLNR